MAYTIAEPCIDVKDTACVDVCPVDCIHPTKSEAEAFGQVHQLYIHPEECIDCGPASLFVPLRLSSRMTPYRKNGSITPRLTLTITRANRAFSSSLRRAHG